MNAKFYFVWARQLKPKILAAQESRRIMVQGLLWQKVCKTTSQPVVGTVACSCHPQLHKEAQIVGLWARPAQA
jgi:hypothetical protein